MSDSQTSESRLNLRRGVRRADDETASEFGLLDKIAEEGRFAADPVLKARGRDVVGEFVHQVLEGSMHISRDATAMINARVAQIDYLISLQLNEILHHPAYQKLESAWRGLRHLIDRNSWYEGVKVRVLNASKPELLGDFQDGGRGRSALYHAVVDERSEALGSEPFSILVGDYAFGKGLEDVELLEGIASVGLAAHAPLVAAASSTMLGRDNFSQILAEPDWRTTLNSSLGVKWRSFRRFPPAQFAVLALPGILLRKPYGQDSNPVSVFRYEEGVDGTDHSKFLWGNPAWAVAAQLGRAFGKGSWCADPSAVQGGGVIRKLPSFDFRTDEGDMGRKGPTEAPVSDAAYAELSGLGFAPVCLDASGSRAVVYEIATTCQPSRIENEDGEVQEPPPSLLRDLLIHCRIAHYLRCIVREKRTWFQTPAQCEQYINRWAARYTVPTGRRAIPEEQQRPFCRAEFHLTKDKNKPEGWFRVEGSVVPNLGQGASAAPIEVSVPVLLTRSAAEWNPPVNFVREDEPAPVSHDIDGSAMSGRGEAEDSFSAASDALERIADLRRRKVLDEPDYLDLKSAILAKMKRLIAPPEKDDVKRTDTSASGDYSVPYGQIHAQIVDLIAEPYGSGADAKQRALKAVSQMDEKGALNAGDPQLLNELLDAALSDEDERLPPDRLAGIANVAARIRVHRASPACRAIAETAEQSGSRALGEYDPEKKSLGSTLWRSLVQPDIEGAFSGGAAAVAITPTLGAYPLFWPVQLTAAFGVMIGAGIRSGIAYGERKDAGAK